MLTNRYTGGATPPDRVGSRDVIGFSLRQLRYFAAAAEHGSVTGAAAGLNVSPASVSSAISHLESICGLQLFVRRHARGLVLTPTGRDMVIEASNLLNLALEFQAHGQHRSRSVHGRLEVGVLVSFAAALVPQLVRRFLDAHPDADIRWHQGDLDFLVNGLEAGRLEVALMYNFDLPSALNRTALAPMPAKVILPAGHKYAGRDKIALDLLQDEPFVLLDLPRTRDYLLSIFSELGLTPYVAYRENSVEMVRSLVASKFGYSLLNFTTAQEQDRSSPDVIAVPIDRQVRGTALSAVWHYRYRMNRLSQTFVDTAREFLSETPL